MLLAAREGIPRPPSIKFDLLLQLVMLVQRCLPLLTACGATPCVLTACAPLTPFRISFCDVLTVSAGGSREVRVCEGRGHTEALLLLQQVTYPLCLVS